MKFEHIETKEYNHFIISENKLTSVYAPNCKTEIINLVNQNKSIIFDMKNVNYIDSSGLSCFLIGDRLSKEKGYKFILCNCNDQAKKIIQLTKLDTILITIPSLNEAKDYILLDELEKSL